MGRDEVCLWGTALTPLDEPIRWLPLQATTIKTQKRRPRVLHLRPLVTPEPGNGLTYLGLEGRPERFSDPTGHRDLQLAVFCVCRQCRSLSRQQADVRPKLRPMEKPVSLSHTLGIFVTNTLCF